MTIHVEVLWVVAWFATALIGGVIFGEIWIRGRDRINAHLDTELVDLDDLDTPKGDQP